MIMPRFENLRYSPSETRRILREHLSRNLPPSQWRGVQSRNPSSLSDESVLKLLLNLSIDFGNDPEKARTTYEDLRRQHTSAPAFDELVSLGWIRLTWGRLFTYMNSLNRLSRIDGDLRATLSPVLEQCFQCRFVVEPDAKQDATLQSIVGTLQNSPDEVRIIECMSPEWVAARLWERLVKYSQPKTRLRNWVDLCNLLPWFTFTPSNVWDGTTIQVFQSAAFDVLRSDASLIGWDQLRMRLVARIALDSNCKQSEIDASIPAIPATFVDRYLWLDRVEFEYNRDDYDACEDLWKVVNILLRDVQDTDQSVAPHPVSQTLFDLSADRPELLEFIALKIHQEPILLADMLLTPRFSALACMLIADWPLSRGGSESIAHDDHAARLAAFTDAVAVLDHFLAAASVDPNEVAALLSWMHAQASKQTYFPQAHQFDVQLLSIIRAELTRLPMDILLKIADSCITSPPITGLGYSNFAAALDVVAYGSLSEKIAPEPFIDAYIRSIRDGAYSLSANGINASSALALMKLAVRVPERRRDILFPLDIRALLAKGQEPGANKFVINDQIARSLRAHIRIVCRAISAWEDTPPADFVEALVDTVRTGAFSHPEKGRVGAFSAKYENNPLGIREGQHIARDLGKALTALAEKEQERLLQAILETDEPLMLAQLLAIAPPSTRARIQTRINALTPAYAGDVLSLTEIQARIEGLLSAGALDAAANFINVERDMQTLGKVPGRELFRLTMKLRLWFLREDFGKIAQTELPSEIEQSELIKAQETLDFYKALSELSKPNGNLNTAETIFRQLHQHHSDIVAYAVNLLAVQVSILLSGNLFGQLHGMDVARARQALADADKDMSKWRGVRDEDIAIHTCNKALLLLAIGQPEQAYEALQEIGNSELQDRVVAYSAVALSRMGSSTDALEALERRIQLFGDTAILQAARAQIKNSVPFDARAFPTSVEDTVTRIKTALYDFQNMDPPSQAVILHLQPSALDNLIINQVRAAVASVVALVPMMKTVKLDSCENDITALVQQLLVAHVEFLKWSVRDQSRGGFTENGNSGERDLVLTKDSYELGVIEAVECKQPLTQQQTRNNLTYHFKKLLGYSTCSLFFHITYSYVKQPDTVLDFLRKIAQSEVPNGFTFQDLEEIPFTDSRPTGFIATYNSSRGKVKVVFLVLDMEQRAQRTARK